MAEGEEMTTDSAAGAAWVWVVSWLVLSAEIGRA